MVSLVGKEKSFKDIRIGTGQWTVDDYFGTTGRAMFSLFELLTLEGWDQVYRPLVRVKWWVFVLVSIFIVIFTYCMLNMVVAFIIQKNMECREELDKIHGTKVLRELEGEINTLLATFHRQKAGGRKLTYEGFEACLFSQAPIRKAFAQLGCRPWNGIEIFQVLEGDGYLTVDDFFESLGRLLKNKSDARALWHLLAVQATAGGQEKQIRQLAKSLSTWRDGLDRQRSAIENSLAEQDEAIKVLPTCCTLDLPSLS